MIMNAYLFITIKQIWTCRILPIQKVTLQFSHAASLAWMVTCAFLVQYRKYHIHILMDDGHSSFFTIGYIEIQRWCSWFDKSIVQCLFLFLVKKKSTLLLPPLSLHMKIIWCSKSHQLINAIIISVSSIYK